MQINLPDQFDSLIRARATEAGFASIEQFALARLAADEPTPEVDQWIANHAEQLNQLLEDGLASASAGQVDDGFWSRQRE